MTISPLSQPADQHRSVFAGADVCRLAGLQLPAGAARPMFDADRWDFTDVIGLPVQMPPAARRFGFIAITDPRWRLVAKELILALLAPRHEAVALLPRAYRTPLHLRSAAGRLDELTRWLAWLPGQGIISLSDVGNDTCAGYLAHRRYVRDDDGVVTGERSPGVRRAAAQVVIDLINYRDLFTIEQVALDLRPWAGASASAIAEMPSGREMNKTPPLTDDVLRPLLGAALYLVSTLGPHVAELDRQVRDAGQRWSKTAGGLTEPSRVPARQLIGVLAGYERAGEPLPLLPDWHLRDRLAAGWPAGDPLAPIALAQLARRAGFARFQLAWIPDLRDAIEATLAVVGAGKQHGRDAAPVDPAGGQEALPWTAPLHRSEAAALIGIVRTATIIVTAATSGMRSSELMELTVGCRLPLQETGPGLVRYRLAGNVIKGQPLGGTRDEWVVIEPVYRAVGLAEQLHPAPSQGAPLFGRFAFDVRYRWFRDWVNGPAGQRLGLPAIPGDVVNLRMLRRTLSIELAYRPGGLLATKIQLKHVVAATSEGYASRPGGAQASLLAEVNKHEADRNLALVQQEFANYQAGVLPAGPGARELTAFFAHVDGEAGDPGAPRVQRSDRDILNLLSKRAGVLHLQAANYCWFAGKSRALCLILAGTPDATEPLAGMCDSARCPQATHHPVHRQVRAEHAASTKVFISELGPTRRTERARLQADYQRAEQILDGIDQAGTRPQDGRCD
jgi:hypothetical protein